MVLKNKKTANFFVGQPIFFFLGQNALFFQSDVEKKNCQEDRDRPTLALAYIGAGGLAKPPPNSNKTKKCQVRNGKPKPKVIRGGGGG